MVTSTAGTALICRLQFLLGMLFLDITLYVCL